MATVIRAKISKKNKYHIEKHRHYELKHFCLQYPLWKKLHYEFSDPGIPLSTIERAPTSNLPGDPTAKRAMMIEQYSRRIKLIEDTAKAADGYLYEYIIKGVTENLSYTYLRSRLEIPCSRDVYYDRYRRFFWLLNEIRD